MNSTISVVEAERVREFDRRCKEYQESQKALTAKLRNAVDAVGRSWRDADYLKVRELVEAALQQMQAAGKVVSEQLVPFVSRKLALIDEKTHQRSL